MSIPTKLVNVNIEIRFGHVRVYHHNILIAASLIRTDFPTSINATTEDVASTSMPTVNLN